MRNKREGEAVVCTAASNVSSKGPCRKKKGSDPSLKGPLQRSYDVGSTVHPKIAQVGSCAESRQKNTRVHPLKKYKTRVFSFQILIHLSTLKYKMYLIQYVTI